MLPSNTEQRGKLRDSVRDLERELRVAKALVKFHRSDAGLAKARETHQRRLAGMALGGGHSDPYKLSQIDKIDPEKEREHAARNAENRRAQIEAELRQARAELEREDRRPKWQTTARLEKEAVASKYRASTNQADSGGAEQDEETAASPDVWRRLQSHNANLTTPVAALASRRQHRPPDARKELIARLKARHQDVLARRICELIDKNINTTPIYKHGLAPLESWLSQAPGSRSWIDVYDHPETHDLVRSYVNKVPRLKTAKSSK